MVSKSQPSRPVVVIRKAFSCERVEEGSRLLEVPGVEALGEPAVDIGQQSSLLGAAAVRLAEPGEAHRRT